MLRTLSKSILVHPFDASARGWVGIDFGSTSIKIVQLRRRFRRIECLMDTWIETPPLEDGNPLELVNVGVSRQPVAFVTSMQWMDLDFGIDTASDLEGLSLTNDSTRGTAYLVPTIKGSGSVKPRKLQIAPGLANWLSDQALQLDCDPRVIDAPPWSLTRAMLLHDPALKNSTSAILDWSASDPLLVVQQGGAPQFTRRLEGGGLQQLTSKIQERLDLPLPCVLHYLARFSTNSPLDTESIAEGKRQLDWALSLLVPGIQLLVEQLTKSFNYLQWQCKELVPRTLLICGGGATLPILVEALSQCLNIPLQVWELRTADGYRLGPASAQAAAMSALEWMR
jgi:hypothetical protein